MRACENLPDTWGGDVVNIPLVDGYVDWRDLALCAQTDPDAFFPNSGSRALAGRQVCMGCEVRAECLEFALVNDIQFGVWGATGPGERRRLRNAAGA